MSNTLGIIGTGMIGGAVARLAVNAGLDVVVSNSRGPESLKDLVAQLGSHASAVTAAEAAITGDWVVVGVPFKAVPHLPTPELAGRIVLDATNYYAPRDGHFPRLDSDELTTSELFAELVPGARVVKTFSTIYFEHLVALARPAGARDRSALPLSGDDATAKESVAALLDRLGYDVVDAGSAAESRRVQGGSPAYVVPYLADSRLPWPEDPGRTAGRSDIRTALERADRR